MLNSICSLLILKSKQEQPHSKPRTRDIMQRASRLLPACAAFARNASKRQSLGTSTAAAASPLNMCSIQVLVTAAVTSA
jgi:hypothetical protein